MAQFENKFVRHGWPQATRLGGRQAKTSDLVPQENNLHSCSSFLCTVVHFESQQVGSFNVSIRIVRQPVSIDDMIEVEKDINVSLTRTRTSKMSGVWNVCASGSAPFQIIATITRILHQGRHTESCKFGGVTTFSQHSHNKTRESPNLCHNLSFKLNLSRSFYSVNSSLHLLMFWYQSQIEADILLTATHCNSIVVCVC